MVATTSLTLHTFSVTGSVAGLFLTAEARKLVPEKSHQWIKVIRKKQSERMPTRKVWDHAIEVKEGFVLRKGKMYPLSREKREEVREFIKEQLRKGYIRPSKSP